MAKKHDTHDIVHAAQKQQKQSDASKWSRTLLALPIAALGLLTWQAAAMAAAPVAAAASQTAENAGQATQQEAGKAEAQQPQGLPVEPVKAAETETAKAPSAKTVPTAAEPAAKKAEPRKNIEVQLEYLEGRFFKKRDVDLYNVHVYRQYKELGALSLHYGLTFERATGSTTEDDIWRDAEAVGFGPSYMMRWTKHISGKLDGSIDGSGSLLVYNHAHPGNGRAYGFLWRIGPRLTYHYTNRDALSLAYLFHHSSNGMSSRNPGYNGVGFSLGFTHWY
ncbi:acyloxyacyl hydrolase [Mitsuokella multacida]|uniref:acyloxyacyl hydrolase n=1 Tax=Mitsuokella multacida TaxID=52226 RepID=UPI00265AB3AF|nr:acyloxyacyl hydrolase [Mitsuokella multacida]